MRVIRDFSACPADCKGAVIALGNFDGVHLGHRAILQECLKQAKTSGKPAAVMTFEPHPREFFSRDAAPMRLCNFRQKMTLLHEAGIDIVFLIRFNKRFASHSAESFIDDVLHHALRASHIVTGHNFFFGKGRQGNVDMLATEAKKLGFGFTAHRPVHDAAGEVISSSAIRALLAKGDMKGASVAQLGRPYEIAGRVKHGEKRGTQLGFPTANLSLDKLFRPRFGIYAARATLGKKTSNGAASIGINPTFALNEPVLEMHMFGMERELYGQCIRVEPVEFLREEQRFENTEALRAQIAQDCKQAQAVLGKPHG